ncbi:MAG: potassium transporter peripheral membrane component [Pseudomonadales bacterium]|nr:potassium transporter peripheral membrane component [Pseudomonadales bacterium]
MVGKTLGQIDLPLGTNIGAIVRGNDVIIAHDDVLVEPDDHLILFLVDKARVSEVEKLFQAPFSFF